MWQQQKHQENTSLQVSLMAPILSSNWIRISCGNLVRPSGKPTILTLSPSSSSSLPSLSSQFLVHLWRAHVRTIFGTVFVCQEEFNIEIHMARAVCRKSQEKTLRLAKMATSVEMPKEGTWAQGQIFKSHFHGTHSLLVPNARIIKHAMHLAAHTTVPASRKWVPLKNWLARSHLFWAWSFLGPSSQAKMAAIKYTNAFFGVISCLSWNLKGWSIRPNSTSAYLMSIPKLA